MRRALAPALLLASLAIIASLDSASASSSCSGAADFCTCWTAASASSCADFQTQCTSCCGGGSSHFSCDDSLFGAVAQMLFGGTSGEVQCQCTSPPRSLATSATVKITSLGESCTKERVYARCSALAREPRQHITTLHPRPIPAGAACKHPQLSRRQGDTNHHALL